MAPSLPVGPFRAWLERVGGRELTWDYLKQHCGLREQTRMDILAGRQLMISLRLADTVITRAGGSLEQIYPFDEYPIGALDDCVVDDSRPAYCREYEQGAGVVALGKKYGCSRRVMETLLVSSGVRIRPAGGSRGIMSRELEAEAMAAGGFVELALKAGRYHERSGLPWDMVAAKFHYSSGHNLQRAYRRALRRQAREGGTE